MIKTISLFLFLIINSSVSGQTRQKNTDYLKWWQTARSGMYIHRGPVIRYGSEISWTCEGSVKPKEIYALVNKLQPGIILYNRLEVIHLD